MSWIESHILKARQVIHGPLQDMLAGKLTSIEGAKLGLAGSATPIAEISWRGFPVLNPAAHKGGNLI